MVDEVTAPDPSVLAALHRLVPQLSSSATELTADEFAELVTSPASVLLVARGGDGTVLGSLTLALFRVPTGLRAWIEDVVVEADTRGQGVGSALVRHALVRAQGAGARSVDLTSRPSRVDANRLYVSLGFERRDTNVYRISVG